VKVLSRSSAVRVLLGAALVAIFVAAASLSAPARAHAITRTKILKRARVWVKKRVPYSQSGYRRGYRRDCSGFVSMAWGLKKSYTTRTISKRARRIHISSLKPGDAVLIPGHVSIFGGWKSKRKRTYWAFEETTWGSHAKRRVRRIPHGAKALRRKGLTAPRKRTATQAMPTKVVSPIKPPSKEATPAAVPSSTPSTESSGPALTPTVEITLDSTVVGVRFVV
jgi:hypothetical protein